MHLQVANAAEAFAMVCGMVRSQAPDQEFRRQRMQALLEHPDFGGNKTALGKALGFKSGAYVRQMIDGERPITEKTIETVQAVRSARYRGWFDKASAPAATQPPQQWPLDPFVTTDQWRQLTPEQRGAAAWEAAKVVEKMLEAPEPIPTPPEKLRKGRN